MHYHWSHDETGRLTPRQAAGYYKRLEVMLGADGESGNDQEPDIDEIMEEADILGIPRPKGY